mmetsp:Transcript_150153/g.280007  ORF Transcript_150153/g.280007 Transcript_150153/m.280007 type:complete len:414 (-) Transcript_150153:124-1365(-)
MAVETSCAKLLSACGRELGRDEEQMQPIIAYIVDDMWCDTVDALRELSGEQLAALTFTDAKGVTQRLPARLVARIQQKLLDEASKDPAAGSDSPARAAANEKEYLALIKKVERQDAVRQALHIAVADGNLGGAMDALSRGRELLLSVEIKWATKELKLLEIKEAQRKEMDEVRSLITNALKDSEADMQYLEQTIQRGRDVGLPDEEIVKVEDELYRLVALQEKAKMRENYWQQAQDYIRRGQVQQLLDLLQRAEGVLEPEQIALAQRKIPGMEARARLRRDLATTLRSAEPDVDTLLGLVFNAKRSNLPPDEIAEAERALSEAQKHAKLKAMKASTIDREEAMVDKAAKPKAGDEGSLDTLNPIERDIMVAARSQNSQQLQIAIEKAKAAGFSRGQISRLHVQAIAAARSHGA